MDLSSILGSFEPITLDQTNEQASLLKRMDTKYVIRPVQLPEVLSRWAMTHRILEIENKRIFGYHSVYYDTPGLQLYHAHHSGAGNRVKFRTREYTDSQLCFYEIKMRNNKGVTE
ncbi:MAG: VTC domain-containing protein, partial [Sphingomonadales bacterium]